MIIFVGKTCKLTITSSAFFLFLELSLGFDTVCPGCWIFCK